jgi:hypothetical protein
MLKVIHWRRVLSDTRRRCGLELIQHCKQKLYRLFMLQPWGHSGILPTYQRVSKMFWWKGIKQEVESFVRQCSICQQAKSEHCKSPGLLCPLPIPAQAWQDLSMDFIDGLTKCGGYTVILVVVDMLTKYSYFIPMKHPYTIALVAQAFFDNVVKLHGISKTIVSDRDKVFTSHF